MDLEEMNTNYGKLKQKIKNLEKSYNQIEKDEKMIKGLYYKQKYELIMAEEKGDKDEIKKVQQEINESNKKLNEIKTKATKIKEQSANYKDLLESKIEQIKNDPEISKQIDKALVVRYERTVNKLTKEKAEIVENRTGLSTLKELFNNHPSLNNNLKGILSSTESLKAINDEQNANRYTENGVVKVIDQNKEQQLQQKQAEASQKLKNNMTILYDYCDRKKIDKEGVKRYIGILVDNGIVKDGKGQIDVNSTFDKHIKRLNRQIKGYDKRIQDYSLLKNEIHKNFVETENDSIKWYQFGKRFKMWWERRKNKNQQQLPTPGYQNKEAKEERKTFNENLKFDIVREAMENQQKEDLKNAKQYRKQEINDREER